MIDDKLKLRWNRGDEHHCTAPIGVSASVAHTVLEMLTHGMILPFSRQHRAPRSISNTFNFQLTLPSFRRTIAPSPAIIPILRKTSMKTLSSVLVCLLATSLFVVAADKKSD